MCSRQDLHDLSVGAASSLGKAICGAGEGPEVIECQGMFLQHSRVTVMQEENQSTLQVPINSEGGGLAGGVKVLCENRKILEERVVQLEQLPHVGLLQLRAEVPRCCV